MFLCDFSIHAVAFFLRYVTYVHAVEQTDLDTTGDWKLHLPAPISGFWLFMRVSHNMCVVYVFNETFLIN